MLKYQQRLLVVAIALGGCTVSEPSPALQLRVAATSAGECTLSLDGKTLSADELTETLKISGAQEVHLSGMDMSVPFRCVCPTVAALQRANVPFRLGFISEPPADSESARPND